jgi:hypothetical protein
MACPGPEFGDDPASPISLALQSGYAYRNRADNLAKEGTHGQET